MVEIAERLGVNRTTVAKWRQRSRTSETMGFPEPRVTVSGTPIWLWPDVKGWWDRRRIPAGFVITSDDADWPYVNADEKPIRGKVTARRVDVTPSCPHPRSSRHPVAGGAAFICRDCGKQL